MIGYFIGSLTLVVLAFVVALVKLGFWLTFTILLIALVTIIVGVLLLWGWVKHVARASCGPFG